VEDVAQVLEAQDGADAFVILERVAACGLNLVLIDQVLPRRSGLEGLRLSKQRWPWVPMMLITGFGSEGLVTQALRAGTDYLKKPIDVDDFQRIALCYVQSCSFTPTGAVGDLAAGGPAAGVQSDHVRWTSVIPSTNRMAMDESPGLPRPPGRRQ
jgi:CheY-like chemotaxis protein